MLGLIGLSVRPIIVTLIGYLVIVDATLNGLGWALDLIANPTLINRVILTAWSNFFAAGYFWHYNELWIGGRVRPAKRAGKSRSLCSRCGLRRSRSCR